MTSPFIGSSRFRSMHSFAHDESVSVPAATVAAQPILHCMKSFSKPSLLLLLLLLSLKLPMDGKGRVDNIVPHYKANTQ